MPGNIKSAIAGICRKLGPGSAERCLASFARRDNRRYQHQTVFPASSIATCDPNPCPIVSISPDACHG